MSDPALTAGGSPLAGAVAGIHEPRVAGTASGPGAIERRHRVAVLPGDGVGPEVTAAALDVLRAVGDRFAHTFALEEYPVGWVATAAGELPLPEDTLAACLSSDAVLLGAVGDPRSGDLPSARRPEAGLLELRRRLGCYANLRPARLPAALVDRSPLRPERVAGTDLLVVRELGGGLYYGEPRSLDEAEGRAVNTLVYTTAEVRRIARVAFELARTRRGHVVSVDKANVLEVSRLWRTVVDSVAREYPDIRCEHMLVDRAAMELILRPAAWDVWLTANLFGDILTDELAAVIGSIGLMGSASLGDGVALYEPVHGSAPDIAGRDLANPVGAISSTAMMLRHSFGLEDAAAAVEAAVERTLVAGLRTADLAAGPGEEQAHEITVVGTREFADRVVEELSSGGP